jgi:squalene-hopene/tetraprenyl-beta-curcumene cyclase
MWLFRIQNRDGGWPTFCRGWGTLPFDRSSPDLTAHAIRAIAAWIPMIERTKAGTKAVLPRLNRGFNYLVKTQHRDGSWTPLWFGNQDRPDEENPIYGTARVLLAYRELDRLDDEAAVRGVRWLIASQNADGGWGTASPKSKVQSPTQMAGPAGRCTMDLRPWTTPGQPAPASQSAVLNTAAARGSSVEESAWALEGLLAGLDNDRLAADNSLQTAIRQGVDWLVRSVEDGLHRQPAPVGFYFAKLWYYEMLYPLIFTVSALSHARERLGLVEGNSTIAKTDLGG